MKFVLIELIFLAVALWREKDVDIAAKAQGKDAASVILAFTTIASKNHIAFTRLKAALELLIV